MWKIRHHYSCAAPCSVLGVISDSSSVLDHDGEERKVPMRVMLDLTSDKAVDMLPTVKEMSFSNVLAAGINLSDVPTVLTGVDIVKAQALGYSLEQKIIDVNKIE